MDYKYNLFRKFSLFCSLFFVVSLGLSGCSNAGLTNQNKNADSVYFKDIQLEKVIREALGSEKNEIITIEDLATIKKLDASMLGIKSIEGLQNASGLIELNLAGNEIRDLSPLSGLINIEVLYLSANQIEDVSILSDLKNLTQLYLHSNRIKSIESLSSLTLLKTLTLEHNRLESLNGVQGKNELQRITAGDNKIKDISALEELPNIGSLDLYNNKIADLSPLLFLKGLNNINLSDNKIEDITPLLEISKQGAFKNKFIGDDYDINLQGNPLSKLSNEAINEMHDMGIRISD